ncbi:MAG: hypothetical protein PHY73_05785 [Candidatus Omnitrophica bacterium]|nr:hypothetical protein [Candidatus Omnitrophota bacterium]
MKFAQKIFFLLIFLFCFTLISFAAEDVSPSHDSDLEMCYDEVLDLRFSCESDWIYQAQGETIFLVISEDPAVTLTLTRSESWIKFLNQLDRKVLQEIGHYSDGFATEECMVASQKAVKVKAFSQEYEDIRLLDYYFMNDGYLYSVLFSVDPKERWDDYKFLIQDVVNSFEPFSSSRDKFSI